MENARSEHLQPHTASWLGYEQRLRHARCRGASSPRVGERAPEPRTAAAVARATPPASRWARPGDQAPPARRVHGGCSERRSAPSGRRAESHLQDGGRRAASHRPTPQTGRSRSRRWGGRGNRPARRRDHIGRPLGHGAERRRAVQACTAQPAQPWAARLESAAPCASPAGQARTHRYRRAASSRAELRAAPQPRLRRPDEWHKRHVESGLWRDSGARACRRSRRGEVGEGSRHAPGAAPAAWGRSGARSSQRAAAKSQSR